MSESIQANIGYYYNIRGERYMMNKFNASGYDECAMWVNNDGRLHRYDGPAVVHDDGEELWYINGIDVTIKLHDWAKERNIDLNNLSEHEVDIIKMEWSYIKLTVPVRRGRKIKR